MSKHKNVSLKLLIDTERQIVLFAEASESLRELLSDMLSQSVGAVISLLRQHEMGAGPIAKLCKSIENMKLNLTPSKKGVPLPLPLPLPAPSLAFQNYNHLYGPSSIINYGAVTCFKPMPRPIGIGFVRQPKLAASRKGGAAVVFGYLITDDLEVMPLSTISIMTQLNKFGVKDVAALEEKLVHLGLKEAVKLLNASLQSKTPLTDVFLPRAKGVKRERFGDV